MVLTFFFGNYYLLIHVNSSLNRGGWFIELGLSLFCSVCGALCVWLARDLLPDCASSSVGSRGHVELRGAGV